MKRRNPSARKLDRALAIGLLIGVFLGAAGVAVIITAADIAWRVPT